MKAFLTSGDQNGKLDGSVRHHLFHVNKFTIVSMEESEVIFIVITHFDDYKPEFELFNKIKESGKPIVIVDYLEYGWDKETPHHFFGINTESYLHLFACKEYIHLDTFLKENINQVKLYFKREFGLDNKVKTPFKVLPIDYTGILKTLPKPALPNPPIPFDLYDKPDSLEEFNNRPIDILMIYGRSNPSREQLHGEIMKQAHNNGWNIITNATTLNNNEIVNQETGVFRHKNNVVLLYQQHFERLPMATCLKLQQYSKITISLNGCGKKCFRHAEASYNSVMALQENGLKWAYDWDESNSIELTDSSSFVVSQWQKTTLVDTENAVSILKKNLDNKESLYNTYLNGIATWEKYETKYYVDNHFIKNIRQTLNGI